MYNIITFDIMPLHSGRFAGREVSYYFCFLDVRGEDFPKPYFDTKVKVRWDDSRLYVAARLEETDFWGTLTQDESLGKSEHHSSESP